MWGFVLKRVSSSNKYCSTKVWFEIESILIFACVSVNRLTSILVAWYLFGPGSLCFFAWYLSQVGLSQVLSFFLPSIWAMLERAMCSFFLLATLSQTREVPADVVKTSRACFFSAFALNYFSEPCRLFFPVPLTLWLLQRAPGTFFTKVFAY